MSAAAAAGMTRVQRAVIADFQLRRLQRRQPLLQEFQAHGKVLRNGWTVTRPNTPSVA